MIFTESITHLVGHFCIYSCPSLGAVGLTIWLNYWEQTGREWLIFNITHIHVYTVQQEMFRGEALSLRTGLHYICNFTT